MTDRAFPVFGSVREAYAFVSGNLPQLARLGRGPAAAALVLGLLFDPTSVFRTSPIHTFASLIAYSWYSFLVFRLILLGDAAVRPPVPETRSGEGPALPRPLLAAFMGRALVLGAGATGVFFLLAIIVVFPATVSEQAVDASRAGPQGPGHGVVDTLLLGFVLFALPIAVPLARCAAVLPAAATGFDTTWGGAWRLSRGCGFRLAGAWILIGAPYFLGYAMLTVASSGFISHLGEDVPGTIAGFAMLLLVTAIGMTVTALVTHATASAWSTMVPVSGNSCNQQDRA